MKTFADPNAIGLVLDVGGFGQVVLHVDQLDVGECFRSAAYQANIRSMTQHRLMQCNANGATPFNCTSISTVIEANNLARWSRIQMVALGRSPGDFNRSVERSRQFRVRVLAIAAVCALFAVLCIGYAMGRAILYDDWHGWFEVVARLGLSLFAAIGTFYLTGLLYYRRANVLGKKEAHAMTRNRVSKAY